MRIPGLAKKKMLKMINSSYCISELICQCLQPGLFGTNSHH